MVGKKFLNGFLMVFNGVLMVLNGRTIFKWFFNGFLNGFLNGRSFVPLVVASRTSNLIARNEKKKPQNTCK